MKTIGITGGTGFIGKHLTQLIRNSGDEVIIFTRDPERYQPSQGMSYAYWCAEENKCDLGALKNIHAMVHLAGAGIADKRWTEKRKKIIVDSRVQGTEFLVSKLKEYGGKCEVLVSASAIGYYGPDRGGQPFTEADNAYDDFLGRTCVEWENAAQEASNFIRTSIFRFGIVLGAEAGAFKEFEKPVSFGIMPILGSGKQVVSWIHVNDLVRMLHAAVNHSKMKGVYNAVAPHAVTHRHLMQTIVDKKGGMKIPAPVPGVVLKLMMGEMSQEVLKSCTVSAQKVQDTGFNFKYPTIDKAVAQIIDGKRSR